MRARSIRLGTWIALLAAPLSTDRASAQARQHESRDVGLPTAARLVLCHGHGCRFKSPVAVTEADRAKLQAIMAAGAASARAERAAIGRAVAWAEQRYGAVIGTTRDRAKTGYTDGGDRSQLDCVDESLNTTSLLVLIAKQGWLRHHRVGEIVSRGYFLDGRYPHQTAVIVERESGRAYAVDSWPRSNGKLPDILPLSVWSEQGGE